MLQHVVNNLMRADLDEVVVVLGHRAEQVFSTLRGLGCRVVINHQYALGMSSSIRRGLDAVHPFARAVLIALGDQPHIPPAVVDGLLEAYRQGRGEIIVPTCRGRWGHPVLFGRKYWRQLQALDGDVGGREILRRHARDLVEVEVDHPQILQDIDRPEDADCAWP
jgi:molybdenum cofactor cytidylyltransferase